MDEFYSAKENETPVTIIFPVAGKNHRGEPELCQQTRTHYYGTQLSPEEVIDILQKKGFVQVDNESEVHSVNYENMCPANPGVHEFRAGIAREWGRAGELGAAGPRYAIRLELYFEEWDLYHDSCPDGEGEFCPGDCSYNHSKGWDYEYDLRKTLSLVCD